MKGSVKRTTSRDETKMVGVQGSAEAEASSHQTRKRYRKTKVDEGSSDQPQEGDPKAEVVEGSSDQPKEGGEKTKKQVRDQKRYRNMRDGAQKYEEMGPQVEFLKNETAEVRVELGILNSELLPAITQNLKTVTQELEIVKNDNKNMKSLFEGFAQSELTKDDKKNMDIPWDEDYLNVPKNLMTDSECPPDISDLLGGMSKEEILDRFGKTMECHEELKKEIEGIKSRLTNIETMIRAMTPKK